MNLEYPSRGQLQQTLASIFRDSKRGTPPTAADASLLSQQLHHDEGRGSAAAAATIDHVGRLSLRQVQQHVEALFVVKLSAKMLEAIEEAVQLQLDGLVTRLCLDAARPLRKAQVVLGSFFEIVLLFLFLRRAQRLPAPGDGEPTPCGGGIGAPRQVPRRAAREGATRAPKPRPQEKRPQ